MMPTNYNGILFASNQLATGNLMRNKPMGYSNALGLNSPAAFEEIKQMEISRPASVMDLYLRNMETHSRAAQEQLDSDLRVKQYETMGKIKEEEARQETFWQALGIGKSILGLALSIAFQNPAFLGIAALPTGGNTPKQIQPVSTFGPSSISSNPLVGSGIHNTYGKIDIISPNPWGTVDIPWGGY